jgi:hypothetical protein
MSQELIIHKIMDLLRQAFHLRENPNLICSQSRISGEAILREVYKREFGHVPPKITFQSLMDGLRKKNIIPHQILLLFETVQRYGNMTIHPDDDLSHRTEHEARIVESNLSGICNWFFNQYLNLELGEDLFKQSPASQSDKTTASNYEDLIRSALEDRTLELDEYENLIEARNDLGLETEEALAIEQKVCLEIFNKKVSGIIDILSNIDLESFRKLDVVRQEMPEWVSKCLQQTQTSACQVFRNYLGYYFPEVLNDDYVTPEAMYSIIGCWQGWYFQYASKTYFDLLFLAKNEHEFIGISVEPINPTWSDRGYPGPYLLAEIQGLLDNEILFTYEKTYLLENPWTIHYEGVIIENGLFFEGEWSIREQNGSFNATRTKSLLPIRIFDTQNQYPVVTATYLNRYKDLTSSWFIQITGKESLPGVLHIIDIQGQLFANMLTPQGDNMALYYCEGHHEETAKVSLHEVNTISGEKLDFTLTFSIDWNNFTLNGIIKDPVNRMRAFKGFKI